jgi:hypothetical protein
LTRIKANDILKQILEFKILHLENIMVEREKYVDESWKESAAQDKEKLDQVVKGSQAHAPQQRQPEPEPVRQQPQAKPQPIQEEAAEDECGCGHDHSHEHAHDHSHEELDEEGQEGISFLNHVATLSYQAMIFMGEIPNPMTNMPEENLDQAKFFIDTLAMLREKTKGNLSPKETEILNTNLYQLQMRFVDKTQKA